MADTIGDLIDKLSISNIRLWNLEDARRDYCDGEISMPEDEMKIFLKKISLTNRERNDLIDQINAGIGVLIDKIKNEDSTFNLTAEELLGNSKNKFYSGEDK
jgi:hypothetical protein